MEKTLNIIASIAIAGLIIGAMYGVIWLAATPDEVRSKKPLKPRLELKVVDNKVDTIYVYSND